jgi:hypothetical protein
MSEDWKQIAREAWNAGPTTSEVIIDDLKRHGLDALFEPLTQRRLQRCWRPQDRGRIRAILPKLVFHERENS